jgi:hypothetical protein
LLSATKWWNPADVSCATMFSAKSSQRASGAVNWKMISSRCSPCASAKARFAIAGAFSATDASRTGPGGSGATLPAL